MQQILHPNKQTNKVTSAVVAFVLWLATAAVGLWQITIVREMLFALFARFSGVSISGYEIFKQAQLAAALGTWLVVILAIVWIIVFVGGAEYHYRHVGTPRSWRLFAWTIGVELAIFALSWFIL
jgi:hypothetical protein